MKFRGMNRLILRKPWGNICSPMERVFEISILAVDEVHCIAYFGFARDFSLVLQFVTLLFFLTLKVKIHEAVTTYTVIFSTTVAFYTKAVCLDTSVFLKLPYLCHRNAGSESDKIAWQLIRSGHSYASVSNR